MNPFEKFNYTADFTWSERNFPNQRALSYLWAGSSSSDYEVALYNLIFKFGRLSDPREKFLLEEPDNWTIEQMASSPIQGAFYAFLANSMGSKRILEIGTFIGVTTMLLAQNVPVEGMVVSIEKSPEFADIARRNFERNGFGRIQVLIGELPSLVAAGKVATGFDFILIDGGKEHYQEYLAICLDLLDPRGIIVMDNCFFLGDVVNEEPTTSKGRGVRASLELVSSRADLDLSIVPFPTACC